jgi:hypothetical protein
MGGDLPQEHVGLAVGEDAGGEGYASDFKHGGGEIRNSKFEIRKEEIAEDARWGGKNRRSEWHAPGVPHPSNFEFRISNLGLSWDWILAEVH